MLKNKFKLQLFADPDPKEPDPKEPPKDPEPKGPDPKDPPEDPLPKYTDDDIDRIINQKFAEWQKKKDDEISEAQKLAEMNAQQKAEYEADKLKEEINALKEKDNLVEMTKAARKMLLDEEINASDELLGILVSTDAEGTKAAVESFSKLFKEAVETAVKGALKGEPPKAGTGKSTITKEDIMKIKNPIERQQKIAENMDLFRK